MTIARYHAFLLLGLGPLALAAQDTPDDRWLPWMGCWQAGVGAGLDIPVLCIRPTADPLTVEAVSVVGGKATDARALVADGEAHRVASGDCAGSQVVTFSTDGRRIYLQSTLTCAGAEPRTASGIWAMGSPTVWLDVQAVTVDEAPLSRVVRYHPAPASRWPEGFLASVPWADRVMDASLRAAEPMTLADVREAAAAVRDDALSTLLLERNQRFALTAANMIALDDAGVPGSIVDALVAVSFPARFAVDREETAPVVGPPPRVAASSPRYDLTHGWAWDYQSCGYAQTCGPYANRAADAWTYPYPSFANGYVGVPRIVDRTVAGKAVRGTGYVRSGSAAGTAQPRTGASGWAATPSSSGTPNPVSTSSSSSGSSSAYSRGGSPSSGGSSGTAKRRGT